MLCSLAESIDCHSLRSRLKMKLEVSTTDTGNNIEPEKILEIPFDQICAGPISLARVPRCQFRFLCCRSFVDREFLRVFEFPEIPVGRYSAISYVWRGLELAPGTTATNNTITIDGAEAADPISVEVLRTACVASLHLECEFLWMDGLCVMQSDGEDKAWQIQKMYDIYKSCKECLIIPGGLSRLSSLYEETFWIHRAWTLQEAVAPPSSQCLFSWGGGNCVLQTNFPVTITEIESGKAAIAEFKGLLQMSLKGSYHLIRYDDDRKQQSDNKCMNHITIFRSEKSQGSQVGALIGALDLRGKEGMANAIWRSSFMRSAKFPVDMIFSIMGLMGVTLETSKFKSDDRLGATIALMGAMLKQGRRAEWLGIATHMDMNPELSTIPVFPKPSASGKAIVTTKDGDKEIFSLVDDWWMIEDAPRGTLDEQGYHELEALAAPISLAEDDGPNTFKSVPERKWKVIPAQKGSFYAIFIGKKAFYLNGTMGMAIDLHDSILMLVQEHAPGKFHALEYAFVSKEILEAQGWAKRDFKVGGRSLGLLN